MEFKPKIINYRINKKNIKTFQVMDNRRQISEGQVNSIKSKLLSGEYIDLTFIVNKIDNKYRIIDGNHRFEAVRKIIENSKSDDAEYECNFYVFNDVPLSREPMLYDIHNLLRPPRKSDFLNVHIDEIQFYKLIRENDFPCLVSIYKSQNSLLFPVLLDALASTKRSDGKEFSPIVMTRVEIVEFAKDLLYDDFVDMKNYVEDLVEVFGKMGRDNIFSRLSLFSPLLNLYYLNVNKVGRDEMKDRMNSLIGNAQLIQLSKTTGRAIQSEIRKIMLSIMNKGKSKNLIF